MHTVAEIWIVLHKETRICFNVACTSKEAAEHYRDSLVGIDEEFSVESFIIRKIPLFNLEEMKEIFAKGGIH